MPNPKLTGAGISADKIFLIPDDQGQELVIEDLVDAEVYVQAVNEELRRSVGSDYSFPAERLPVAGRPKEVETWCNQEGISAPSKTAVAYRVLDEGIGRSVLAERYHEPIEQLFKGITSALKTEV